MCFEGLGLQSYKSTKRALFFRRYAYHIALSISVASLMFSLFYSEFIGFIACTLCIVQRFFFYPQLFILSLVFIKKEYINRNIYKVILALSIAGFFVALYHYYGQVINPDILSCDVVDGRSTCASVPFKTFGFITIPMMSLIGFSTQIVLMIWYGLSSVDQK